MPEAEVPVIGFAAFSGTGKTTLLTRLLPLLKAGGLRIGVIKHSHHRFEIDKPGKDSYELRKAGAEQMLISSPHRWALVVEKDQGREPRLAEELNRLDQGALDLILVEGFKQESFPKIELYRPTLGKPALYPEDPDIIAVATDGDLREPTELPVLDLNDVHAIAEFVLARRRAHTP